MSLSDITASYLAQFPDGAAAELLKKEFLLERFGSFAFGGLMFAVFAGVCALIYVLITRMIFNGANPIAGIILSLFVGFAALTLAYVFMRESLKDKKIKMLPRELEPTFQPAEMNALPQPRTEWAPSVVEDSTELLPIQNRTQKLQ